MNLNFLMVFYFGVALWAALSAAIFCFIALHKRISTAIANAGQLQNKQYFSLHLCKFRK